jgi:hypothetical protein
VTRVAGLPFSNYYNISSSSQLSIPPKTMSSGTVHVANFYITAQRLLEAAKMHWKWGNVIKNQQPMPIPVPKGLRE